MVGGVTKWLSWRSAASRRPPSDLGAFVFPAEIILMITQYLRIPSLISLALTCRHLAGVIGIPAVSSRADQRELVQLLEKDIASLYYCRFCVQLHRWKRAWGRYPYSPTKKDIVGMPCRRFHDEGVNAVEYNDAHLVMNGHFYSPAYGAPPHSLERTTSRIPSWPIWSPVAKSASVHARIYKGELLVVSDLTVSHPLGNSKRLRDYINASIGVDICRHITLSKYGRPWDGRSQLPELYEGLSSDYFATCTESFHSCSICLTDYRIDISWRGRLRGYMIKVRTYRLLGGCRSYDDWSWRILTGVTIEDGQILTGLTVHDEVLSTTKEVSAEV